MIHTGHYHRIDTPVFLAAFAVVALDRGEALVSCAKLDGHATTLPPRLRVPGLDATQRYRLTLIWPQDDVSVPAPSIIEAAHLQGDGVVVSGESLDKHGLQLPLTYPDVCLVFHLEAIVE